MSILEIILYSTLGIGILIYGTIVIIKAIKGKKHSKGNNEDED